MSLIQHKDDSVRYQQQVENSEAYLVPFIDKSIHIQPGLKVLEVGTGEGGVLKPFIDRGCYVVGVDLNEDRIELANQFLATDVVDNKALFITKNILDEDFVETYNQYFDIIILKDAIEHIPSQETFIPHLFKLVAKGGIVFFGFPPWYMPFGGHQQLCESVLSKVPWFHLLPNPLYFGLLRAFKENDNVQKELKEIKSTAISIERFERIVKQSNLVIDQVQHYLINPIYKYKFGLKPRKQWKLITAIPFFRNFATTTVYYNIKRKGA
jgi:SAM-dependent methyltransferase